MKAEGKTMFADGFNQHRHTFILHPSSFILSFLAEGAGFELAWAELSPPVFETGAIPVRRTLRELNFKSHNRSTRIRTEIGDVGDRRVCR